MVPVETLEIVYVIWFCVLFLEAKQFEDSQDHTSVICFEALFTFMMFVLHPLKGVNAMGVTTWQPNAIFALCFIYTVIFFSALLRFPCCISAGNHY